MQLRIRYMLYSFIRAAVLKDKLRRFVFRNESESFHDTSRQCLLRFSDHSHDLSEELREPGKHS